MSEEESGAAPDNAFGRLVGEDLPADELSEEPTPSDIVPGGADLFTRLKAKLGRDPEEQRRILQSVLGASFETKLDEGKVLFKQKGAKGYKELDPEGFSGGLSEALKDTFVDLLPEFGEGVIGAGAEAAGATAGAAAGSLAGGPGVGTAVGLVAGAAAGGALAPTMRDWAIRQMGAQPTFDPEDEAMIGAGLNVGMLGAGALLRPLTRGAGRIGEAVVREAPSVRVDEAADVLKGAQDILTRVGIDRIPRAEHGQQVFDAIGAAGKQLEDDLGVMKAIVRDRVDMTGDYWDTNQFVQTAQEVLTRRRGVAIVPTQERNVMRAELDLAKVPRQERQQLQDLAELYNEAQKQGGRMSFDAMDKGVTTLEANAIFDPALKGTPIAKDFTRLRGALRQDQELVARQTLDDEEWSLYKSAYDNYTGKIDEVRAFRKDFLKKAGESGEKFLDGLIKPGESTRVKDLKRVLGEESAEFGMVRDFAAARLLDQARNPKLGFVDGTQLRRLIDGKGGYGADVLGELYGAQNVGRLRAIAQRAEKIRLADIAEAGMGQSKEVAQNVLGLAAGFNLHPLSVARFLYGTIGKTKQAAEWLNTEGMNTLARQARTPLERRRAIRIAKAVQEMSRVTVSRKANVGGREIDLIIVPRPGERVAQQLGQSVLREPPPEEGAPAEGIPPAE